MYRFRINIYKIAVTLSVMAAGCKAPSIATVSVDKAIPETYSASTDTTNSATVPYRQFFQDQNLVDLIDTALKNNQELKITTQEIEVASNDIGIRKGALLPTLGIRAGAGVEKVGRYTSQGAGDASTEIVEGKPVPEALTDLTVAAVANWEVDIWKRLRNAKKAAITRYLSTVEGRNFATTNLISELAGSYYELQSLDRQLRIVQRNIELQKNALEIVKVQKQAARATELAVQKFQAEVFSSRSLEFDILQKITEAENKINFLLGRYPQHVNRDVEHFLELQPMYVQSGIPSQLLENRADIKQAELDLKAAQLDVKVARAEFYPSLDISAAIGLQAFKPSYFFKFPESVLYNLVGELTAPLINRNAIKSEFSSANARQLSALYNYQRVVLNAYIEVANQLSKIDNLGKSYTLKSQQVAALTKSIDVSNDLFKSARVDYFEVLMTQRDALESQLNLNETKRDQLIAAVNMYRNLGGGWK